MRTENYSPRQKWDQHLNLAPGKVESIVHGIPEWVQLQLGQTSSRKYEQAIALKLGLSLRDVDELLQDFYSGDRLDGQLISLIARLRASAIPVGLLSNNPASLRDDLLRLKVLDLFASCIISAEIAVMKPDPAAYRACLSDLQVSPNHALLIDDSQINVEGALAIGMAAIHFHPSIDLETQLFHWINT